MACFCFWCECRRLYIGGVILICCVLVLCVFDVFWEYICDLGVLGVSGVFWGFRVFCVFLRVLCARFGCVRVYAHVLGWATRAAIIAATAAAEAEAEARRNPVCVSVYVWWVSLCSRERVCARIRGRVPTCVRMLVYALFLGSYVAAAEV